MPRKEASELHPGELALCNAASDFIQTPDLGNGPENGFLPWKCVGTSPRLDGPWLYSKFGVSLRYKKACFKQQQNK